MALIISVVSLVLIVASIWGGQLLRRLLPDDHLAGDSKEVIRLATALIGTLAAVVLALLFSSTRASYELTNHNVARLTAGIMELDTLLEEYGGTESATLRRALRADVQHMIDAIWRDDAEPTVQLVRPTAQRETVLYRLRQLAPANPLQSSLQSRALAVSTDLDQTRLTLFAQPPDSLAKPFIFVLVLWLCLIFASFSMSSSANPTLMATLLACALAAATAIYLILELGQPFDGLLQIPNESLRTALKPVP